MSTEMTKPSPDDINLLASFLVNSQLPDLSSYLSIDTVVICVSAVLHPAELLFRALESNPSLAKSLVLCGGIGHSTPLIYEAVACHPIYHPLASEIQGLPESQVLFKILGNFFDVEKITSGGCKILIEDQSTNCSANAVESRKILEASELPPPKRLVLIQDATMSIRTKASFDQVYSDLETPPEVLCWPGFVPKVKQGVDGLEFDVDGIEKNGLWEMDRFLSLIMGEIPRLKMYGPEGKGSIAHVEVPKQVRDAWERLNEVLGNSR